MRIVSWTGRVSGFRFQASGKTVDGEKLRRTPDVAKRREAEQEAAKVFGESATKPEARDLKPET
ncbi:MAG: hypothetical protein ACRDSJ_03555 [Rubrobacteraceae bacterium]